MPFDRPSLRTALCLFVLFAFATIAVAAGWSDALWTTAYTAGMQREPSDQPGRTPDQDSRVLVVGTCDTAGPIEVQGTVVGAAPTAYATLADAFTAINDGFHTGAISVDVCGNTTETTSATLNRSAGSSSYTSVTVRPVGAARTITGNITGAVIKLNGADNVTIDGRIGGIGNNRDLTVTNTSTAGATAAIWLASVIAGNGATNNTIRNLEISTGTDSTSISTNASFGVIMCGSLLSATTNGVDNDNNSIIANRIIRARYGIVTRGTTSDLNINPVVTDNIVGPTNFGSDQIGKAGIYMQADTGAVVSRNTVQFVGCLDPQACVNADRMGIAIGDESWSGGSPTNLTSNTYTVTKNEVHDIVEETGLSAVGIRLGTTAAGSATNNVVANNFIYNVRANGTIANGDQSVGIGISGGHTDRVVFNSISMTGDVDPGTAAPATNFGSGIRIANANGTTQANLTLQNNSIYMDLSSSSTAGVRFYAISGNSAAYSFGTGGENYNNYYINPVNPQLQTGGLGTTSGNTLTTQFATLANWQTAYTVAQDTNSKQADPFYISNTSNLHITSSSPNESMGIAIAGISDDIDGDARVGTPDIGADEISATMPGTLQFGAASYFGLETGGTILLTVTRTGGTDGAVSAQVTFASGTATGAAACGAGVDYVNAPIAVNFASGSNVSQTVAVPVCDDTQSESNESFTAALGGFGGGAVGGSPTGATVTIYDNDSAPAQINVTTAVDELDGSCLDGDCSLRDAVFAANATSGNEEILIPETITNITLSGSEIVIQNNGTLRIAGFGANQLRIGYPGTGAIVGSRIFYSDGATVTISGMTLAGGDGFGAVASGDGGALYANGGAMTLNTVHLDTNHGSRGGGVFFNGGSHVIEFSTCSGNTATNEGGCVEANGAVLAVTNSTVTGNSALGNVGGGINVPSGTVTLTAVTISSNTSAVFGGGLFISGGSATLRNSIVAGNTGTLGGPEIFAFGAAVTSGGFNLIGDTAGDAEDTSTPITYQSTDLQNVNPMLQSLAANGGPTPTRALDPSSPAIDKGSAFGLVYDQRGGPRPTDLPGVINAAGGDGSDIGAFEHLAPTAANASLAGRVSTADGVGIRGAIVTVEGGDLAEPLIARTNIFGFYAFDELPAGRDYIVTVAAKRYVFTQPTIIVPLGDSLADVDFVATP